MSEMLEAALAYAAKGWKVFPCKEGGKSPLVAHGFKDATTDERTIRAWWDKSPSANIGYAPNRGVVIIDVDPRNGGTTPADLPKTLTALTGGGGYHYYYTLSNYVSGNELSLRSTLDTGVDVKGNGTGYVLLPPSVTEQEYRWEGNSNTSVACASEELEQRLIKPAPTAEVYNHDYYDDPTDTRPGTQFNRSTRWDDILTPHGWRVVGVSGGETYWCRPGKSEGISATTNYQGSEGNALIPDLMYVFTTSTVLEAGKSYSKFSAYTELEHGGDYTAAARVLATGADSEPDAQDLRVPSVSEELSNGVYNTESSDTQSTNHYTELSIPRPHINGKIERDKRPSTSEVLRTVPFDTDINNDILIDTQEGTLRGRADELLRLSESSNSKNAQELRSTEILDGATINTNVIPKYTFTPALPPDHFISRYIEYVAAQTDAPLEYGEASALTLLSLASYKCKSALSPYPGGLANNLYITLVGPTTRSRKSTVQRITSSIIKQVMPPSLLPNRATTEALIKALANRNGVPSVWCPDEFGVTLAEIYNRDYMRGLEEMLLTVYSGDDYEYQRVLDSVVIRSPHLSVLGAATPESISRAGTTALDSGLLPRFAIVYPAVMPGTKAVTESDISKLRAEKQYFVSKLNEILTWSNTHEDITFEASALSLLNEAESTLQATSAVRLPTMLYKVSALIAVGASRSKVQESDAKAAIAIVSRWADGVAALIPQMYKHGADQQFEQQLEYVLDELSKTNGMMHRITVANLINVKKQRLDEIESTLVDKGRIRVLMGEGGKQWHLLA